MSIEKLMRRNVLCLPPTATCCDAADLMRDRGTDCILVVENHEPVGVVTDHDLVTRVMALRRNAEAALLRDVMSVPPVFLSTQSSLEEAIERMRDSGFRRLPIVDSHNRPMGLLSLDDVLLHVARQVDSIRQAMERERATSQRRAPHLGGDLPG